MGPSVPTTVLVYSKSMVAVTVRKIQLLSKFVVTFSILLPIKAYWLYVLGSTGRIRYFYNREKPTAGFMYSDALIMVSQTGELPFAL